MEKNVIEKEFIASTEGLNDHGFRVLTAGIRLERFKKNPICLAGHWGLAGKWLEVRVEGGKLILKGIQFSRNELGQRVKNDIEDGILTAVSIGIRILATSEDPALMLPGQRYPTVVDCELYEVSIVDMPSNPEALEVRLYAENEKGEMVQLSAGQVSNFFKPLDTMKLDDEVKLQIANAMQEAAKEMQMQLQALQENLSKEAQVRAQLEADLKNYKEQVENLERGATTVEMVLESLKGKKAQPEALLEKLHAHPKRSYADWWVQDSAFLAALKETHPEEWQKLKEGVKN